VEPERLGDDRVGEALVPAREAVLRRRVAGEGVEGPGDQGRGGLVAADQERHEFVAQGAGGEALPGLVAGL
jgi:hypothetical protein